MIPNQYEIEIPLLKCLEELGGKGKPKEIYSRIGKFFPNLTEADRAETVSSGGNKWTNRVQWARQALVNRDEMTSPEYGVWQITNKGRKGLEMETATGGAPTLAAGDASAARRGLPVGEPSGLSLNLEVVADKYLSAFTEKVQQRLQHDLSPEEFEQFAGKLLTAYGFGDIEVTGRSGDGGIDGHGKLKVGLASMNVAFQCKRWQGSVGRPEIDKFRGAIQGEFEQGIFFTTSTFSSQAQEASIKKGAAPIVLLDGDAIVQLMVEKGLGVQRKPVELYEDQIDALFEKEG